ncbi:GDP-fucose protein O-fucosyltransferase 1 isoform X3 [Neocloeon triangulifer]|nr:GDP-fucose protein O-fucosyltransferase 1 isoform X3 [Neocloeon triangulifer]XP_059485133.1 GDP-fucose protein O-fucosyltransferase 1 isoform X3 [Neocloeon triangulifer]
MGRFGNQADHFLGSLGFARGLNRTLVLPPWVEYRPNEVKSHQVPFDFYFDVKPLEEFHRVITMEKFMRELAPKIWPPEKRISFCYMARNSIANKGGKKEINGGCNAKDGNPFGPFWDTFNIDFVGSEMYAPLHYDVHHGKAAEKWNEKYSPSKWPVLAFTGAPASFPVQEENRGLHQYLKWSEPVRSAAMSFIHKELPNAPFIGIHLRNGMDWVRACQHIPETRNLFSSPQCLGYNNEHGTATPAMCMPNKEIIIRQLRQLLKNGNFESIFVASDNNHMLKELANALKKFNVVVKKLEPSNPHVELAILGMSNHFVGNCVSSFSSFVKRERDSRGLPSSFWAFPDQRSTKKSVRHDEF